MSFGIYSSPCSSRHAYLGAFVKPSLVGLYSRRTELGDKNPLNCTNECEELRLWPWCQQQDPERGLWEAAQRPNATLEVRAWTAFLLPRHLLYAVRNVWSPMLFTLCQRLPTFPSLPRLQLLRFFNERGGPGTRQPPTSLPAGCFGQIPPAAERFLSSIGLYVSVHRVEVMTCI